MQKPKVTQYYSCKRIFFFYFPIFFRISDSVFSSRFSENVNNKIYLQDFIGNIRFERMCHVSLFRFRRPTSVLVTPSKKAKKCTTLSMNKEIPTGFCHWDKITKIPGTHYISLTLTHPFKSSDKDQGRKGERGASKRKGDTNT